MAVSAGIPATVLHAAMDREDLSTTQQYIRVTGRDLERAMARIKAWRAQGWSLRKIARELNEKGTPAKNGGRWHPGTVKYLLENNLYDAGRI